APHAQARGDADRRAREGQLRRRRLEGASGREGKARGSLAPEGAGLEPGSRPQELRELRLGAARLRREAVLPARERRQRHQDGLDAAARLQAEQRSAVVEQVELDVAPAPVQLELPLALA